MIGLKASFIKRLGAFLIDSFILSFIITLISMGFNKNTNDINKEINELLEQYQNGEVTIEEYADKFISLNYELQKSSLSSNVLNITFYVGYFMIFGYLNKGQTIGKKICKIKVVNSSGDNPSIWNMVVRSLFIYGLFTLLFSVIFVNVLNTKVFTTGYLIITYIDSIIMIICLFMVLYKKDGRGLHDIIARTNVIEEVR